MILTCPNCGAKFNIKDGALGTEGRKVKCSKCDHRWHATPDGDAEGAPPAPPPPPAPSTNEDTAPPSSDGDAATEAAAQIQVQDSDPFSNLDDDSPPDDQPAEATGESPPPADPADGDMQPGGTEGQSGDDDLVNVDSPPMPPESNFRPPEPERSSSAIIRWVIFILVLVVIIIGVVFFRKDLVTIYPPLNKVYEVFGFAPDTLGHGLELPQPSSDIRKEGSDVILTVTGKIENTTSSVIDVPYLRGVLSDSSGKQTMTTKTFKPTEPRILPGEKIEYSTEIKNPPAGSVKLTIIFARKEEKAK